MEQSKDSSTNISKSSQQIEKQEKSKFSSQKEIEDDINLEQIKLPIFNDEENNNNNSREEKRNSSENSHENSFGDENPYYNEKAGLTGKNTKKEKEPTFKTTVQNQQKEKQQQQQQLQEETEQENITTTDFPIPSSFRNPSRKATRKRKTQNNFFKEFQLVDQTKPQNIDEQQEEEQQEQEQEQEEGDTINNEMLMSNFSSSQKTIYKIGSQTEIDLDDSQQPKRSQKKKFTHKRNSSSQMMLSRGPSINYQLEQVDESLGEEQSQCPSQSNQYMSSQNLMHTTQFNQTGTGFTSRRQRKNTKKITNNQIRILLGKDPALEDTTNSNMETSIQDPKKEKEGNQIQVQIPLWKKYKIIAYFVGLPLVLIFTYMVYHYLMESSIIDVGAGKCIGNNRDPEDNCQCFKDHYVMDLKTNDCVGPIKTDIDYNYEDIEISLAGQGSNIVTRIMKERQIEFYKYSINNVQKLVLENTMNITKSSIEHNVAIVTTDVKKDYFSVLLYFSNSTSISPNQKKTFREGYPKFYEQEIEDKEKFESAEDILLPLYQEKVIKENNITKMDYLKSSLPLVKANITKTGDILNIVYPISMSSEQRKLIPSIMNQYSPPLTMDKYSSIEDKNPKRNRRFLKETNETTQPLNTQPGLFEDQEKPQYQAEIDRDKNEAKINKNYQSQSDSKNGTQVPQESTYDSQVQMKDGRMDESAQTGTMNMVNPEQELSEKEKKNQDGEVGFDGEVTKSASETKILMKQMDVENFSVFKFQKVELLEPEEMDKLLLDFNDNFLKNSTFEEFQIDLFDEIKFYNAQPNIEKDMKTGKRRILSLFDDMDEVMNGDKDQEKILIPKKNVQLFQFKMLGISVKGEAEFECFELGDEDEDAEEEEEFEEFEWPEEFLDEDDDDEDEDDDADNNNNDNDNGDEGDGDEGDGDEGDGDEDSDEEETPKDICYITPVLNFAGMAIKPVQASFQVPIAKYLKGLNWLRYKVIYKSRKVLSFINKSIYELHKNIRKLNKKASKIIEVEKNLIAQKIKLLKIEWNAQVEANFSTLEQKTNEIIAEKSQLFDQFLQRIQGTIQEQFYYYFQNSHFILENLEESYLQTNLQSLNQILSSQPKCAPKIQLILKNLKEQVQYYQTQQQQIIQNMKTYYMNQQTFQPLMQQLINIDYLTVEDSMEDLQKLAYNMANSLLNNALQGKMNQFIQSETEKFDLFYSNFQQNFERIITEIVQKIQEQETKCQGKLDKTILDEDAEDIEEIVELIDFYPFVEHQEIAQQIDKKKIPHLLPPNLLQDFRKTLQEHTTSLQEIQNFIQNFVKNTKKTFQNNAKTFETHIKELSNQLVPALKTAEKAFKQAGREMTKAGLKVFEELIKLLIEGNPYGHMLSNLDDITRGVEDLKDQVIEIKATYGRIQDANELALKTKQLAYSADEMHYFLQQAQISPFETYRQEEIDILKNDQVKKIDFEVFEFEDFLAEIEEGLEFLIEDEIEFKVIDGVAIDFGDNVDDTFTGMKDELQEQIYDQLKDLDQMFEDIIMAYLENFELEKMTIYERNLFEKIWSKEYRYMTPIGVPIYLEYELAASVDVEIDLGIRARTIDLEPRLIASITADVEGGVDLLLVKAGGFATATIFKGVMTVALLLAFQTDVFKGQFSISVGMDALQFEIGFFWKHITIKLVKKCLDVGIFEVCAPVPWPVWTERKVLLSKIFKGYSYTHTLFRIRF